MQDAIRRRFDVIAAWSLDRLGRSLQDLYPSSTNSMPLASTFTCISKHWTPAPGSCYVQYVRSIFRIRSGDDSGTGQVCRRQKLTAKGLVGNRTGKMSKRRLKSSGLPTPVRPFPEFQRMSGKYGRNGFSAVGFLFSDSLLGVSRRTLTGR